MYRSSFQRHRSLHCPARVAGFTLMELVLVMVVTGVMAIVATAAMNSVGGGRAAGAARLIQRDLTFARQRAIATGNRVWAPFNLAGDSYSLLMENPAVPGRVNAVAINDPGTGQPFLEQLGSGAFVEVQILSASFDGGTEIGFDWLGQPLNSAENALDADATIQLSHGYQVIVHSGSGRITIDGP